jgi:hypothetical protein
MLAIWSKHLIEILVDQGFDRNASRRRIDELIRRYEDGWNFQLKPHLRQRKNA